MRLARPLAALLAAALLATLVPAAAPAAGPAASAGDTRAAATAQVTALAVAQTDQGYVGTHAQVTATVLSPGSGQVFVATKPIALQDMQGSARLASKVAARVAGADWASKDYLIAFTSESAEIGGPSAGAAMTLALSVALHDLEHPDDAWTLDPTVAVTGTINPDGTIGPVGGIPAKAEAAAEAGIQTFLYPVGLEQAPTLVAGRFGPQQVVVDMASHCADLGIACRPVSTLREVVSAAAHVELTEPPAPVPQTRDYSAQLTGVVTAQMDSLATLERDARAQLAGAGLSSTETRRLAGDLDTARADLEEARAAFANQTYYLAATSAFQGRVAARSVEAELGLRADRDSATVAAALDACDAAIAAADALSNRTAATATEAWAVGAARVRLDHARELAQQARAAYTQATSYADWADSVRASAFCQERAATVGFWANLTRGLPAGPALDARAAATEALDEAAELVAYAASVLGQQGDEAQQLQQAQRLLAAGEPSAALVAATEAQAAALVALQGAGTSIPQAVLDNARDGASRAVAQARADGAEPILSVSLVELASTQAPADALQSLWEARTLALVASGPPAAPAVGARTGTTGSGSGAGAGSGIPALPWPAAAAAVAAAALVARRRRTARSP